MSILKLSTVLALVFTLNISCKSVSDSVPSAYAINKRHTLAEEIKETSGLILYNGLVWTFNDSGGEPVIYGYSLSDDSVQQRIHLKNAINKDWEDIAQDDQYIYIGDFGNNSGSRDSLVIYRLAKSSMPKAGDATLDASAIVFTYPNYTPSTISVPWSEFDCEAMVCFNDSINIFSKDWINGTCTIYSLPKQPGRYIANKLTKFNSQGLVTGADIKDNTLVLIGYTNFMPFIWVFPSVQNMAQVKESLGKRTEITSLESYQTEGICIVDKSNIIISSEETRSPAQIIEMTFTLK